MAGMSTMNAASPAIGSDPASRVEALLDTMSIIGVAASALEEMMAGYSSKLPKQCMRDVNILIDGLKLAHKQGRCQTRKVSTVPYALEAYDSWRAEERAEAGAPPRTWKGSTALWEVKQFVDGCSQPKTAAPTKRPTGGDENPDAESPPKRARRSERIVSPEKSLADPPGGAEKWTQRSLLAGISELVGTGRVEQFVKEVLERGELTIDGKQLTTPNQIYNLYNKKGFTGKPPNGAMKWKKEELAAALSQLESEPLSGKAFLRKVVEGGKTKAGEKIAYSDYNNINSVYNMYKKWKETGKVRETGGRPPIASHAEIDAAVCNQMETKESNCGGTVKVEHMKSALEQCKRDKADADGLDGKTVKATVCDKTAKKYLVAGAMRKNKKRGTVPYLSSKKLMTQTEKRYGAITSVQGAMAYALTVLSTHFCEGPCPPHLASQFKWDDLNPDVQETLKIVKEALGADEIHPIDNNLAISTDDTTLFVFEGCAKTGEWQWKLIDKTNSKSSVRSDFEVGDGAGSNGGLRVRLTFSMSASGMTAPLYVAVSGLTDEELSPELCPDGILSQRVDNLCKGGNDLFTSGFGYLVFLRADKKDKDGKKPAMSIGNKKFVDYNTKVLLPFIRKIREKLGWIPGTPIPEWMKACCWFDGDIPQLQTMLYEAYEAMDIAENIVRNKHSASATGTQQPCDLSPIFKLLKLVASRTSATQFASLGLDAEIDTLFAETLRAKGLNLDGNLRKKKALMDFLKSLPRIVEEVLKAKLVRIGFVESGMIDEETGLFPSLEALMQTSLRWGSTSKDIGLPKAVKDHIRNQVLTLFKVQLEKSQVTAGDMTPLGIPRDIDSRGREVVEDRPSGPNREHMQYAKTVNGEPQRRMRKEKRRQRAAKEYSDAVHECNTIADILRQNGEVEEKIRAKSNGILAQAEIKHFHSLSVDELKPFIHARKFNGKTFQKAKLCGNDGKLNKLLRQKQTPAQVEAECSNEYPCLVWLAWTLRSSDLVLKERATPVLDLSVPTPSFVAVSAEPVARLAAKDYLRNETWVNGLKSTVKGFRPVDMDETKVDNAGWLEGAMSQRLAYHCADRVDSSKQDHWTLRFVHDNLANMAASFTLAGHVVDDVDTCAINERLLVLPSEENTFVRVSDGNGKLQGCYLYYHKPKSRWIRSGFTAGESEKACFSGRGKSHWQNAKKIAEMIKLRFYRQYPARGVENLGVPSGYFDDLVQPPANQWPAKPKDEGTSSPRQRRHGAQLQLVCNS
ncbi:hypothetical protein ACHAXT_001764 [Thalassiosira profunda]